MAMKRILADAGVADMDPAQAWKTVYKVSVKLFGNDFQLGPVRPDPRIPCCQGNDSRSITIWPDGGHAWYDGFTIELTACRHDVLDMEEVMDS